MLGLPQKSGYSRSRSPGCLAHALGRAPTERHLKNRHSDLLSDPMDHLEHRCLASSGSASKNAERLIKRHLHTPSLPDVQVQSRAFLKAGYRFGNDRWEIARE